MTHPSLSSMDRPACIASKDSWSPGAGPDPRLPDLKGFTVPELEAWVVHHLGASAYRGRQIFQWIHRRGAQSFLEMTDLPQDLRVRLTQEAMLSQLREVCRQESRDGTIKFLFQLEDGQRVEGVWIPEEDRNTLCLSTQVGCGMGCRFCFTAQGGLSRNLRTAEIVDQVLYVVHRALPQRTLHNLVLMGMGEPLANEASVFQALRILTHPLGLGFPARRITLSTVGLIPGIRRLAQEGLGIQLAISLNATTEAVRDHLMPINRAYSLNALLHTLRSYSLRPRQWLYIEYVLLDGVNDSPEDARRLARKLRGIRCKINLIRFNPFPGSPYRRPPEERVLAFQRILRDAGYLVFLRKSRGEDILAACGQLRGQISQGDPVDNPLANRVG